MQESLLISDPADVNEILFQGGPNKHSTLWIIRVSWEVVLATWRCAQVLILFASEKLVLCLYPGLNIAFYSLLKRSMSEYTMKSKLELTF